MVTFTKRLANEVTELLTKLDVGRGDVFEFLSSTVVLKLPSTGFTFCKLSLMNRTDLNGNYWEIEITLSQEIIQDL